MSLLDPSEEIKSVLLRCQFQLALSFSLLFSPLLLPLSTALQALSLLFCVLIPQLPSVPPHSRTCAVLLDSLLLLMVFCLYFLRPLLQPHLFFTSTLQSLSQFSAVHKSLLLLTFPHLKPWPLFMLPRQFLYFLSQCLLLLPSLFSLRLIHLLCSSPLFFIILDFPYLASLFFAPLLFHSQEPLDILLRLEQVALLLESAPSMAQSSSVPLVSPDQAPY